MLVKTNNIQSSPPRMFKLEFINLKDAFFQIRVIMVEMDLPVVGNHDMMDWIFFGKIIPISNLTVP